jgi:hypothetical protein
MSGDARYSATVVGCRPPQWLDVADPRHGLERALVSAAADRSRAETLVARVEAGLPADDDPAVAAILAAVPPAIVRITVEAVARSRRDPSAPPSGSGQASG